MNANDIVQLLWILYLVFGLSFLFNKKYYKDLFKDITKSKSWMFYWWCVALIIWFIIILFFNEWTLTREWVVTFIWWAALVKWIVILLFPKFMVDFTKSFTKPKHYDLTWYSMTVVGILLIYLWFIA